MFCKNCGAQLPDDSKFCTTCGTNLADAPAAQPVQQPAAPQNVADNDPSDDLPF